VKTAEHLEMWQDSSSSGHYLKSRFSIARDSETLAVADEPAGTPSEGIAIYELQGMVVQIQDEGESAHLVSLIKGMFIMKQGKVSY